MYKSSNRYAIRLACAIAISAHLSSSYVTANEVVVQTNSGWAPFSLEATLTGRSDDRSVGLSVAAADGNIALFGQQGYADADQSSLETFAYGATAGWVPGSYGNFDVGVTESIYGFNHFCYSIAMSGDSLVLGQPTTTFLPDDQHVGSAIFFRKSENGWSVSSSITRPVGVNVENFGCRVVISGDSAAISAPFFGHGLVFVAHFNGMSWEIVQTLLVSDPNAFCAGCGLAIDDDTIVIGAPGLTPIDNSDSSHQAAFVFKRISGTWREIAKLQAPDQTAYDDFAESVAVSGETIVIGAPQKNGLGAIYIFRESGASVNLEAEFIEKTAIYESSFGESLALSGDRLLVGERGQQRVRLLERKADTWMPRTTFFLDSGTEKVNYFGFGLALSNHIAVIGSPGEDAGRVYVFRDDELFGNGFETR